MNQASKDAISKFYEECHKFNDAAGKLENLTMPDVYNQLVLIKEELDEAFHAYQVNDTEGVLDASVDVAVTAIGFCLILEKLGFDVDGALLETAKNNLTKFIDGGDTHKVDATVQHYKEQGVKVYAEYNHEYNLFVIKDMNNKIRKPVGFISNSLVQFVPQQLQQKV